MTTATAQEPPCSSSNRPGTSHDAQTANLFAAMAAGDPRARDELIERHLPLARSLAARYRGGAEPFDDLVQVASFGLCKAVDGFEASRGHSFSSYAVPTILGELKRHFRDRTWSMHVPRALQELSVQVSNAVEAAADEIGHSPTVEQVSAMTGLTTEEVLDGLQVSSAYRARSLDAPVGDADGDGDRVTLAATLGAEDPGFELTEYGVSVAPVIKSLSDRDRLVLHLRFVEDLTQTEIARRVGVSQMQVSRILRRSLQELREAARAT
jgi:RNA polymerase sigma-B factor